MECQTYFEAHETQNKHCTKYDYFSFFRISYLGANSFAIQDKTKSPLVENVTNNRNKFSDPNNR